MAKAAMLPRAGADMAALEEVELTADRMAEEAWLAMELTPEAAELKMELTAAVFWAETEAARAAAATKNFISSKEMLTAVAGDGGIYRAAWRPLMHLPKIA